MTRPSYLLSAFFIFFFACSNPEPVLPIAEEKLVKVLADIHVAEAAMQNLTGDRKDSVAQVYYEQIEKIHGIERTLVDSAIIMMRKNPKLISKTYTLVLEELSKREAELK